MAGALVVYARSMFVLVFVFVHFLFNYRTSRIRF